MKFVVMGGAGAMGRLTVRDLFEFGIRAPRGNPCEVVIADYNFDGARALAESFGHPNVTAAKVDVTNGAATTELLQGAFAVINSVQYQHNLKVMEAALAARSHYIDLGGLFHMTREQLKLNDRFREANLLALLGMGAAPGITNILARMGANHLDRVTEVHIRSAFREFTRYKSRPPLWTTFSLPTQLDELTQPPALFTGGAMTFVPPMSGFKRHTFPDPLGRMEDLFYALHSEVATLPYSFGDSVREVSFKLALDPDFLSKARFLIELGMASRESVEVGGVSVPPIALLDKLFRAQGEPVLEEGAGVDEYEILRAIVKGWEGDEAITWIYDFHSRGIPMLGIGVDADTGSPPAIAALLLASGLITSTGTVPPEIAVPPDPFVAELHRRGMRIESQRIAGWDVEV